MTVPFGPVLIGRLEKTLNALLLRALAGTGIDEREWVTLRLADTPGVVDRVRDEARFGDAAELVEGLTRRGLLVDGRLSTAGRSVIDEVTARLAPVTAPLWGGLPEDDVAATVRTLNAVLERARPASSPR